MGEIFMKKGIAILIAVFAVIGIIIGTIAGSYNGLVSQQIGRAHV